MKQAEVKEGNLILSSVKEFLDVEFISTCQGLSYWLTEIPKRSSFKFIEYSLTFFLFETVFQIGIYRLITYFTPSTYSADAFVREAQKANLFRPLIDIIFRRYPELQWPLVKRYTS